MVTKYPDIFDGFRESVENDCPECEKVLVRDGKLVPYPDDWTGLTPSTDFSCARYGNIGWKYVMDSMNTDILYCGDDIRFIERNTVRRLQKIAYLQKDIGMLSPKIIGGAQVIQNNPRKDSIMECPPSGFIGMMCVYIKRSTIKQVGYLDERFVNYGHDDVDYCNRIREAGLLIGVTAHVTVKHGLDEMGHSTTFRRQYSWKELCAQDEENRKRFEEKNESGKV